MPIADPVVTAGIFSGGGTFTVPLGVTSLSFTIVGGRGGDGGDATGIGIFETETGFGGNGGSGASVTGTISVVAGNTITVALGTAGTNGANVSGSNERVTYFAGSGTAGGTTTIQRNGSQVASAGGGSGGSGGSADVLDNGFVTVNNGAAGAGGSTGTGGTVTTGTTGGRSGPSSTITWS